MNGQKQKKPTNIKNGCSAEKWHRNTTAAPPASELAIQYQSGVSNKSIIYASDRLATSRLMRR